jgi:hypothetical protein
MLSRQQHLAAPFVIPTKPGKLEGRLREVTREVPYS